MADLWLLQVSDTEPLYRVLRLDRDSGGVVAAIDVRDPAPLQGDSAQIAFGAGAVWVAAGHRYLYRLDPAANRLAAVVDVGYHLDGLAASEDGVWLSNDRRGGRLLRVDPNDNRIDVAVPHAARHVALGGGAVWTTWNATLSRIDPETLGVTGTVSLGAFVMHHAFAANAVWAITLTSTSAAEHSTLWRIDPATMAATAVLVLPGRSVLVSGGDALWLGQTPEDGPSTLSRFDLASHALTGVPGASFLPEVADHEVLWGLGFADGEPWTGGASVFCHHPGTGIVKRVGTARGHGLAVSP
jgi:hypothetical protein